ncbi:MAG: acylglycerol kinase family protein [Saprospiraceae bacterium]|nr:acylglycerol kinase family protein [Saprospiraceae bacterium]
MNSDQKIHIIHNPLSGPFLRNKSLSKEKASFTKYLSNECLFHIIQHPGDAIRIVREAISSGGKLIVASGGDGTINEVVNGFFRERKLISQNCILGIINRGTGQGVAQSLRLPSTLKSQFQLLQSEAIGLSFILGFFLRRNTPLILKVRIASCISLLKDIYFKYSDSTLSRYGPNIWREMFLALWSFPLP